MFPPPLIDAGETFFSRRLPLSRSSPGRRYRGILAPGERLTSVEIRLMTALLEFGQYLFDRYGEAADPYMAVVDYFTSTLELAGMRRLAEDDVTDRLVLGVPPVADGSNCSPMSAGVASTGRL